MSGHARLRARRGTTLVELIVVLALLAVLYAIVGVPIPTGARDQGDRMRTLLDARRAAIRERRTISVSWQHDGRFLHVTAFPSGLVLADSGRGTFIVTDEGRDAAR